MDLFRAKFISHESLKMAKGYLLKPINIEISPKKKQTKLNKLKN